MHPIDRKIAEIEDKLFKLYLQKTSKEEFPNSDDRKAMNNVQTNITVLKHKLSLIKMKEKMNENSEFDEFYLKYMVPVAIVEGIIMFVIGICIATSTFKLLDMSFN